VLCFYLKTDFWPSYCQISTDLNKILYTPVHVQYTLVGRLRSQPMRGGSKPNQNNYVFVILVTHPKSYTETTDCRDFGGIPSKWRSGRVLSWKIPEFCSVGGARSKTVFFAFLKYPSTILRTAYKKTVLPKTMVPMESRDSEGVPIASLESLWSGIWQI